MDFDCVLLPMVCFLKNILFAETSSLKNDFLSRTKKNKFHNWNLVLVLFPPANTPYLHIHTLVTLIPNTPYLQSLLIQLFWLYINASWIIPFPYPLNTRKEVRNSFTFWKNIFEDIFYEKCFPRSNILSFKDIEATVLRQRGFVCLTVKLLPYNKNMLNVISQVRFGE